MDDTVSLHAAKTHLSQLLARAEAGEVIGPEFFDPLPDDELDRWGR